MVQKRHALPEKKASCNCSCSSQIESQQSLQPTSYQHDGPGGNLSTTQAQPNQIPITQSVMKSSNKSLEFNVGVTICADRSLCSRISSLCREEFRHQPWYQDNLLFVMASTIAGATYILPFAQSYLFDTVAVFSLLAFLLLFIPLVMIPLWGIQNMIDPVQLTQRHPLSFVRLVIDPARPYFVSRCVFFLCFSVSPIPFSVYFYQDPLLVYYDVPYRLIPFALAFLICFLGICAALIMGYFSICRQVFTRRSVVDV